jgi:hypothetical protein
MPTKITIQQCFPAAHITDLECIERQWVGLHPVRTRKGHTHAGECKYGATEPNPAKQAGG